MVTLVGNKSVIPYLQHKQNDISKELENIN